MRNLDLTIGAEGDFKCWWRGWWSYGWVYSLTRAFQFVWRMVCLGLGGGGDWNRASGGSPGDQSVQGRHASYLA